MHTALEEGLHVILCVGETLAERERGLQERVFQRQVTPRCAGLTDEQFGRLVIAYEPVWAIGTGKVATPEQAQEAHAFIRGKLRLLYGEKIADATSHPSTAGRSRRRMRPGCCASRTWTARWSAARA